MSKVKSMHLKKQYRHHIILLIAMAIFFYSCKKEELNEISLFYGKWKTSYGDTIEFSKTNNRNILRYDNSLNPATPTTTEHEYTYQNNKLGIKNGLNGPNGFYILQSFRWLQRDQQFEVQGVEWFLFISSTQTYFTFTKIP